MDTLRHTPPPPFSPSNSLFKVGPLIFSRPGATVSILSMNLLVLLPYCSMNVKRFNDVSRIEQIYVYHNF